MNFFPFLILSVVFGADRHNSSSTTNSNTNENRFKAFLVNYLPDLFTLSGLTDYYLRTMDSIPAEALERFSRFFEDVRIHFVANGKWEGTFWGVCNNHGLFNEAFLSARTNMDPIIEAVLASNGITVNGGTESVRLYLQDLYRQRYHKGFDLEYEAMFLFLTYLAQQVPAPPTPVSMDVDGPPPGAFSFFSNRPNAPVNAPPSAAFSFFSQRQVVDNPKASVPPPTKVADAATRPFSFVANKREAQSAPQAVDKRKNRRNLSYANSLKNDVERVMTMDDFFEQNKNVEEIDGESLRNFMRHAQTLYGNNNSSNTETKWRGVFVRIYRNRFPREAPTMEIMEAITHVLALHNLLPDEFKQSYKKLVDHMFKHELEKIISNYLHDDIILQSTACPFVVLSYLAFYAPL